MADAKVRTRGTATGRPDDPPPDRSWNPRSGTAVDAPPPTTADQVDAAARAAERAAPALAHTPPGTRREWLGALADAVAADAENLVSLAEEETALGLPRLRGELARAADALRFYGEVAAEGSWLAAAVDRGEGGGSDLRRVHVPLGPVAVFGAGNLPFGFGVLGHDTASALAAGCPVLVKAHPAHPRLSAALAGVVTRTLDAAGAPEGTFALVAGFDAGTQLVVHPSVRAVSFTGSQAGGMALWRLAASRPVVIPVHAEMGTVNPVVVTAAGAARADAVAAGFVGSFTQGLGQFCTKPGLLLAPAGGGWAERVAAQLAAQGPEGWMLTAGIADSYASGLKRMRAAGAVVAGTSAPAPAGWAATPTVLTVGTEDLVAEPVLLEECFGPCALVAEYGDLAQLSRVLDVLPGSLAAAVHGGGAGDREVAPLVQRLSRSAGRVVVDGWPTGVATTSAQHHGGPWPATSAPAHSSVGAAALLRFVRPVAWQDVPDDALPEALRDANPWRIPRRVDGRIDP